MHNQQQLNTEPTHAQSALITDKSKIIPYNVKYHLTWGQVRQKTQPNK